MSSARTYQCLSCRLKSAVIPSSPLPRRTFHTSAPQHLRSRRGRGAHFPNIKASEMGLAETQQPEIDALAAHLRPYTAREKQLLATKYTPAQMAAIEAGERSVDAGDLVTQGRFRTDPMRIEYVDDFATLRPAVDRLPAGASAASLLKGRNSAATGKAGSMEGMGTAAAAAAAATTTKTPQPEEDPRMLRLSQQTGLSVPEIRQLRVKNLVSHRVVNQTRMGKIQSLYFLTIAGNGDGMVGIGEGKAAEDEDGRRQAMMNAVRNMKPIPRYEERTIFGEAQGKVGASVVQLSARPPGFGNRCQHLIFELARAAGIADLAARTPRSRNKMNVVKAAFQALTNQRLPEDVAKARGRKMVDVRGVYYGGSVH